LNLEPLTLNLMAGFSPRLCVNGVVFC